MPRIAAALGVSLSGAIDPLRNSSRPCAVSRHNCSSSTTLNTCPSSLGSRRTADQGVRCGEAASYIARTSGGERRMAASSRRTRDTGRRRDGNGGDPCVRLGQAIRAARAGRAPHSTQGAMQPTSRRSCDCSTASHWRSNWPRPGFACSPVAEIGREIEVSIDLLAHDG